MTDESPGVTLDDDALRAFQSSLDELTALKREAVECKIGNTIPLELAAPLLAAAAVYFKAFLETLAQHNADALIDAVRARIRKRGKTREVLVGPEDGSAATVVVTGQTSDEARLALLDLDVTADELRGKLVRWDETAMVWRADNAKD